MYLETQVPGAVANKSCQFTLRGCVAVGWWCRDAVSFAFAGSGGSCGETLIGESFGPQISEPGSLKGTLGIQG